MKNNMSLIFSPPVSKQVLHWFFSTKRNHMNLNSSLSCSKPKKAAGCSPLCALWYLNIWLRLKAAPETWESLWLFLLSSFHNRWLNWMEVQPIERPEDRQQQKLLEEMLLKQSNGDSKLSTETRWLDYLVLTGLIQLSGNSVRGYMRPFNFRSNLKWKWKTQ